MYLKKGFYGNNGKRERENGENAMISTPFLSKENKKQKTKKKRKTN